jgi:hypothetical protein
LRDQSGTGKGGEFKTVIIAKKKKGKKRESQWHTFMI